MMFSIFPSPIVQDEFRISYEDNLDLIKKFKDEEQSVPMPPSKYPQGSYTSFYTNTNVLDMLELADLKEYIFQLMPLEHLEICV